MPAPLDYLASGTGVTSSRSDWSKDAVQLLVKCGPTRESHEERAIGTFAIHRGGWLTSSAKLGTKSGIAQDPIDWNVVTFGSLSQSWTQDVAKLIAYEPTDAYTYYVEDLTGAYKPKDIPTVGRYIRSVFYLRPNFVLIRDEFTLANLNNTPIFHLHTLDQPVVGITGFSATSKAAGTILFGTAAVMCQAAVPVKATPDQVPTYRMDFPADATGGFCVALEAAPAGQSTGRVTMFTPPGLRGAVLGNDLAAVVTGDLPLTYKSPVTGTHYLLELKPGVSYSALPGGLVKASAAGVLSFLGSAVGTTITVGEGPPPVLTVTGYSANSVQAGQLFTVFGTGFSEGMTVSFAGSSLTFVLDDPRRIDVTAPAATNAIISQVTVTSGGRSAVGPPLTVTGIIPPPVGRKFELLIAPDGTPAIGKEITS